MSNIVVIGAGQAGASLVLKLRGLGFEGGITLLGAEPVPPYQRPPLSKAYLLGDMALDRLFLKPEAAYAGQGITLRTGAEVTGIDRARKVVQLGEEELPYDQLAFTTGSAPRRLPASIGGDLNGVHVVRSLADVDAMAPQIKAGGKALVVGGGYIGLEAAAVLRKLEMQVTVVEAAERILQRVASPATSDYYRALHSAHGVEIREGLGLERLTEAGGTASGALLSDGTTIQADLVVVGIGVVPGAELAEAAGLDIEHGIKTNIQGRTSDPNIWAAGDCASLPYRGQRIRLESVQNAIDQAEAVAANMLGAGADYIPKPWFWSDQYDVKLQIAGLNLGYDRTVTRGEGASQSIWYYEGEALRAVDAMNAPRDYMVGKRLIEAGVSPALDVIMDPEVVLKTLLKP